MSQRYSDLEALRMVLVDLERKFPGSVIIDPATGGVSLIGWSLEQFNNSKDDKCATDNIEGNPGQAGFSGVANPVFSAGRPWTNPRGWSFCVRVRLTA